MQHRQAAVFGSEVVTPLADAMGLVNGKKAQKPPLGQRTHLRQEPGGGQALGCGIQQGQGSGQQAFLNRLGGFPRQAGVQIGGGHAQLVQCPHLVVHQGDQGGDHDGRAQARPLSNNRRHLVAQGLAAAGGHQHQGVVAVDDPLDDGFLGASELVVAKNALQHRMGGGGVCSRMGGGIGEAKQGKS